MIKLINFTNKITSKQINLSNVNDRKKYSYELKEFEKQFVYPLGNDTFHIEHGQNSDYFSFFEKLGKPNIMVLEKNNKIIGVCSAVLREINNKKYWYLCDFKIEKEHRGKNYIGY
ncbi:GNAT family N-acetyltransferase [archaeon]|nr:GNAT family N-acetyltransferase [archaeon]